MKSDPAMLFAGALYSVEKHYLTAKGLLTKTFGPVLSETEPASWNYSDYYASELGSPALRRFLLFENLIAQESLKEIKLKTVDIEKEMSSEGRRTVNIDPGYLTLAKVVLASTKDYSHRIYLGDGIYVEATLFFRRGTFEPQIHAYRDYRDGIRIFMDARKSLMAMLRGGRGGRGEAKTSP